MKPKSVLFATVLTHALLLLAAPSRSRAGLVKLAESGDLEPGGTNVFFQITETPTVNDRGQVAFHSNLYSINGFAQGFGFFLADGETTTTIAKTGQPAPDANGNLFTFYSTAALNRSNQVFQAKLNGTIGGASDDAGMYRRSGGVLTQLAREGQPASPEGGTFNNLQGFPIRINRSGQTAFACGTSSNVSAIYRTTGNTLTRLAYNSQPLPDGNGALGFMQNPSFNNNGQAAFYSITTSTNGSTYGFFLADDNGLKVLARSLQPSPDGNGSFLIFFTSTPPLNDQGQTAFVAQLNGTSGGTADNLGLYRGDGSTTVQLVRKGEFVPNGNGRFLDFGGAATVAINNRGQVAFTAALTGTTGGSADNAGIFLVTGSTVTQLARKGQTVPGGNGVFSTFGYPALNNQGQVAFKSTLTGTSGGTTDDQAIYLVDADSSIQQIIRAGQVIDGETVFTPNFLDGPNYGGMSGLNDEGQMAVWSALNGNHAVYLWSRAVMDGVSPAGNNLTVSWTSFGDATNVVEAAPSPTAGFTNIAIIPLRANRLVRTNFTEPNAGTAPARFYRVGATK